MYSDQIYILAPFGTPPSALGTPWYRGHLLNYYTRALPCKNVLVEWKAKELWEDFQDRVFFENVVTAFFRTDGGGSGGGNERNGLSHGRFPMHDERRERSEA